MKKIKMLVWEGSRLPKNTYGADVVIHQNPFYKSGSLGIIINNTEVIPFLPRIFTEEMDDFGFQRDFFTSLDIETLRKRFNENFSVSFLESRMVSPSVHGGRLIMENNLSLN